MPLPFTANHNATGRAILFPSMSWSTQEVNNKCVCVQGIPFLIGPEIQPISRVGECGGKYV